MAVFASNCAYKVAVNGLAATTAVTPLMGKIAAPVRKIVAALRRAPVNPVPVARPVGTGSAKQSVEKIAQPAPKIAHAPQGKSAPQGVA